METKENEELHLKNYRLLDVTQKCRLLSIGFYQHFSRMLNNQLTKKIFNKCNGLITAVEWLREIKDLQNAGIKQRQFRGIQNTFRALTLNYKSFKGKLIKAVE